jgi:hypothetical protein
MIGNVPPDGNCEYSGIDDPDDARADVLGRAKNLLLEQDAIIGRLTGEDGKDGSGE